MNTKLNIVLVAFFGLVSSFGFAHINPEAQTTPSNIAPTTNSVISAREDCQPATGATDQNINNVRARLLAGGDVWWDLQDGKYIVPNPPVGSGITEVSSIFAGGVWIGGLDPAGNLKMAATTYRTSGRTDFYSGPLDPVTGQTDLEICNDWDRFFTILGTEIKDIVNQYNDAINAGEDFSCDSIPDNVRYWPGKGNPFFFERWGFDLPNTGQGLGSFWDDDGDGLYNPCLGDFPIIEIRGCEPATRAAAIELLPDEMIFWIYNDAGAPHRLTQGEQIQMEVQVQAFAYATNDEVNDMTFQRYKLINRAREDIRECYFAMWVDPDLGCFEDDYVGCDESRSLAIVYNEDALDGSTGTNCTQGVPTYEDKVPYMGIDYFRGPLGPKNFSIIAGDTVLVNPPANTGEADTIVELGMSSFIYYNNGGVGDPEPQTTDPNIAEEYYNYIRGFWRDGTAMTFGGNGFNLGSIDTSRFIMPGDPNDQEAWSMCTANLPFGDRRTLQASGPLLLKPGARNELIIGVVWVPDVDYPCPDLSRLRAADDLAQALFDNCFDIIDGPDAPDLCGVELDQELILVLSNDSITSNNAFERYSERDILASEEIPDDEASYNFEGYRIYQLANSAVTAQELDNVEKAKIVREMDIKNGVEAIYNWSAETNPFNNEQIWSFEKLIDGSDAGIAHTIRILEDQFASGDRSLINHKAYHFMVLAYGYNNYQDFDPNVPEVGQRTGYLEGRNNVRTYTFVPRPIVYKNQNAQYGDGAVITRISGVGVGGNFLDLDDSMYDQILSGSFDGNIVYDEGAGPIEVKIYDPINVKDGRFRLELIGDQIFGGSCALGTGTEWKLTNLDNDEIVASETTIDILNEQLLPQYGFSIAIEQSNDPGDNATETNGGIGIEYEYADEAGANWYLGIQDDGRNVNIGPMQRFLFNFIKTNSGESDENLDPNQAFSSLGNGEWYPFTLTSSEDTDNYGGYITPAWNVQNSQNFVRSNNGIENLNNVDIVFTSNKDLWSRCVVLETASEYYALSPTEGGATMLDPRRAPSVDKNGSPDGSGNGFGWFPGYAIDVETGKRLNILFGENSVYGDAFAEFVDGGAIGRDMIYNPTSQLFSEIPNVPGLEPLIAGGNHFIYVTRQEYDGCEQFGQQITSASGKINALKSITWTSMSLLRPDASLESASEGLIPNDLTVKLRVDNKYSKENDFNISAPTGCNILDGAELPTYEFEILGKQAGDLTAEEHEGALANVNVVPNPYYGFSAYEQSQFTTTVKITNLPDRANVTIYSLDGKFIKQFRRDERPAIKSGNNPGIGFGQTSPDLSWDLNNFSGIPIASGIYLIHIAAPDLAEERTIKWFGVNRKFDPSGL